MRGYVLPALVIGVAAIVAPASAQEIKVVSSADYAKAPGSSVLLDIREPSEWAQTGIPAGAKGVSISRTDFVESVLAEVGGDKTKPVALICRSGNRSARGAEQLKAAGFTNVINIGDGVSGREGVGAGWIAAGLPTASYTPKPAQ